MLAPFKEFEIEIWGDPHVFITKNGQTNNTDFHTPGWQTALTYDYVAGNNITGAHEAFQLHVHNTAINANGVAVATGARLEIAGVTIDSDATGALTVNGVPMAGNTMTVQSQQGQVTITINADGTRTIVDPLGTRTTIKPNAGQPNYLDIKVNNISARSGLGGFAGDAIENGGDVNVKGNYARGTAGLIDDTCAVTPPPLRPDGTTPDVTNDACKLEHANGIVNPKCPPPPPPPPPPDVCLAKPFTDYKVEIWGDPHVFISLNGQTNNTDFHTPGWQTALTYDYSPGNNSTSATETFLLHVHNTAINANGVAVVTGARLEIAGVIIESSDTGVLTINGAAMNGAGTTIQSPQGQITITTLADGTRRIIDPLGTQTDIKPVAWTSNYLDVTISNIHARSRLGGFAGDAIENGGDVAVNGNYARGTAGLIDDRCAVAPNPFVPDGTTPNVTTDACTLDQALGVSNPRCTPTQPPPNIDPVYPSTHTPTYVSFMGPGGGAGMGGNLHADPRLDNGGPGYGQGSLFSLIMWCLADPRYPIKDIHTAGGTLTYEKSQHLHNLAHTYLYNQYSTTRTVAEAFLAMPAADQEWFHKLYLFISTGDPAYKPDGIRS